MVRKTTDIIYRVIRAYKTPYGDPTVFRRGDRLRFERRETEWEGWIWCTAESGKSAWVPEAWVRVEGGFCVMERDYSALELSVESGETLSGNLVESGWLWAKKADGQEGWVPLSYLEKAEHG